MTTTSFDDRGGHTYPEPDSPTTLLLIIFALAIILTVIAATLGVLA